MDLWAFLDELVCFPFIGWKNNLESILLISPVAGLSDPISPLQDAECRFTAPPQDAGIIVLS
jgi:hypothetical protein